MRRVLTRGIAGVLVGIGLVLTSGGISWGQFADPQVYKITFKVIEFSLDGNFPVPDAQKFTPNTTLDLAAVASGAEAGELPGIILPAGEYPRVRLTTSCTFGLQGKVTFGPNTFKTIDTGGGVGGTAMSASADLGVDPAIEAQFTPFRPMPAATR